VAGQAERVERPELAAEEAPAGLGVAGVEAALEAELERDAGFADLGGDVERGGEVVGERLLAERRQAAADRLRISVAWAFVAAAITTASASSSAASIDGAERTPVSAATAAARSGIASATMTSSTPGVAASSPAWRRPIRPAPSWAILHRASASRSAARPIRSDSAGASHVLSCSSISQPP
jgi:hypothetical protein